MRRKIVLAVVLCLVAAAGLGIGAAPALAASGCTCHTAAPPTGGAPAAHAPLVVGVTHCTTCHKGMTVPHPKLVELELSLGARLPPRPYLKGDPVIELSGRLTRPSGHGRGRGVNRVAVYLQQRAPGETKFVTVSKVTTSRIAYPTLAPRYYIYVDGNFAGRVTSPIWGATYRAVSRGVAVAGEPVVKPGSVEALLKPSTRLGLGGLDEKWGPLKLGRSVTAGWRAFPAELVAGEMATFTLVKDKEVVQTGEATISSTGRFRWQVTPTTTGREYWIYITVAATAVHTEFGGRLGHFKVIP